MASIHVNVPFIALVCTREDCTRWRSGIAQCCELPLLLLDSKDFTTKNQTRRFV